MVISPLRVRKLFTCFDSIVQIGIHQAIQKKHPLYDERDASLLLIIQL